MASTIETEDVVERARQLDKARQLARDNPSLKGWRVCDSHFLAWLSEHMGPENIAYLKLIIRNAEAIAATPIERLREENARVLALVGRARWLMRPYCDGDDAMRIFCDDVTAALNQQ